MQTKTKGKKQHKLLLKICSCFLGAAILSAAIATPIECCKTQTQIVQSNANLTTNSSQSNTTSFNLNDAVKHTSEKVVLEKLEKGFNQQDAQELLLILLDELNISLTQTSLKEMIVNEEIKNLIQSSPSEKADEIWKQYLTANNSIITHSFSGQQQQKIICSECGHYSVSYDPFNCLSLTNITNVGGFVEACVP